MADVVWRYAGRSPARTRSAVVVGASFDSREWSGRLHEAAGPLRPAWFRHQGAVTPESVAELAGQLRESRTNVLVTVGGGSVMDAAKAATRMAGVPNVTAAAVLAACTGEFDPPPSPVRLVAIPTTPGTGAEVTPFATVWDVAGNRKLSLTGGQVRPSAVILDPDLVRGLAARHLNSSLLDTLCQAAEAAWSVRGGAESTGVALAALAMLGPQLDRIDPAHPRGPDRILLQLAGHMSGQAIALAPTSSCHAVSYPLTLRAGLAHGHACGVSLGRMLRYNAAVEADDCADPRGPARVRETIDRIGAALGGHDVPSAADRVERFVARSGLGTLDDLDVDTDLVAEEALSYPRCADNPRALTVPDLAKLLASPAGR